MSVPTWKFWHPLPFWQVLLIAIAAQLICTLPIIALQELAGIRITQAAAGGAGGLLMVLTVRALAARAQARKP